LGLSRFRGPTSQKGAKVEDRKGPQDQLICGTGSEPAAGMQFILWMEGI